MRTLTFQLQRGFTLVELMVVVVVVGILAAVAYPSMTSMIQRSRRADAIAALTAVVQAQERYRSNHPTYSEDVSSLKIDVEKAYKHYDIGLAGLGEAASFSSGYVVTATPRSGSPQASDKDCATLGIKLEGSKFSYLAKKADGTDGDAVVSHCWAR
ncbi:MAG: prepilin-type N-terminal cleavage/methylation domain-containing protein [Oxalobacteraceae bacterium]|nr:MAG: prepilin-type N-terminal cleavage/methylation domain-containing protein [Oxalobacteraceae bacterium]